jgi:phosphinothricin acetyltransferase
MPTAGEPLRVRLARPADAEAIRAIYNAEVLGGTNTFDITPRGPVEHARWMARHEGAHPLVVAEVGGGEVAGFGALSPFRSRPAYATTVEDSVYVAPVHQGAGIGRAILGELLALAQSHGFHTVIARVVGANEASIALHRGCGFFVVGTEREVGRKHGQWLDVVELQRLL